MTSKSLGTSESAASLLDSGCNLIEFLSGRRDSAHTWVLKWVPMKMGPS